VRAARDREMITQEVTKICVVHGKKRGRSLVYEPRQLDRENPVLVRMSNEIEKKPLPRASGCRNVTCNVC